MSLAHETEHAALARARLLEQLKQVAGHASLLDALNAQTQEVEDALWQLFTERWFGTAVGAQLDVIGRLLAEPRAGMGDSPYTERLKAKIRVLRSSGAAPNIITIFKLMLPENTIFFASIGAGGFVLDIGGIDAAMLDTYVRFVREARSAGIDGQIFYHTGADDFSDAFTWSSDDTTQTDAPRGWGPYPEDGTGGRLSDVTT